MDALTNKSLGEEIEQATRKAPVRKATKEKMKHKDSDNSHRRKRAKNNSRSDNDEHHSKERPPLELENDSSVLQRRQKQIDYGKNTVGYHNYIKGVPMNKRTKEHPKTPDKYTKYSRRSWDQLIKIWRKKLHRYDPNAQQASDDSDDGEEYLNSIICTVED